MSHGSQPKAEHSIGPVHDLVMKALNEDGTTRDPEAYAELLKLAADADKSQARVA